ncbi:MAG: SIMPL domain-containing protein, partial [Thermanaeromonas sp.]|uniref:SIMPL domain-containing protein n=1 Tax=Thermanaeromonas sp. TaxID=2003697 RepID=UPI0024389AF3
MQASKLIVVFLVLVFILCFASPAMAGVDYSGITVSGIGKVWAVPDIAEITVGVVTRGLTASQAQEENSRIMHAVIQKLKEAGIEDVDLKTGELSLFPEYAPSPEKEEVPRIVAYRATSSLIVTVKPVQKAGQVVDAALAAGANQVHGLRFLVSSARELELEALSLAVQDARRKGEVVAQALGVKLGGSSNCFRGGKPALDPRLPGGSKPGTNC